MSLQAVDDENIRVLLWAGLQPHADGPLTWRFAKQGHVMTGTLTEATAASVGQMLKTKNQEVVYERYGDFGDPDDERLDDEVELVAPPYVHRAPRFTSWTPMDVAVTVEYYKYQSFFDEDFDDPEEVEAFHFLRALARRTAPRIPGLRPGMDPTELPEWKDSPWGITEETVPPRG